MRPGTRPEQQLLADAQAEGAPHLMRELAAELLGADLARLQAQLRADAPAPDDGTPGGLRPDQAAAAFLVLPSPRRAELIVGPAGTGKSGRSPYGVRSSLPGH